MDTPQDTDTPAVEPIAPEEARQILEAAMAPYLEDGWIVRAEHDFMARITQGRTNMDFYVDLLGEVTREEKPISPVQDSGHLIAWALLLVSFLLAVAVASAIGWL